MIKMPEYAKRRKQLLKQLDKDAIVLIPAAPEIYRNGDTHYSFRQNSDFYYLTGFNEPEAIAVLIPGHPEGEFILFNRKRDLKFEIWDGPRAGQDGARDLFGADLAYPIEEFKEKLSQLLMGREVIYYPIGASRSFDDLLIDAMNQLRAKVRGGVKSPSRFVDVSLPLHEMRLIKSADEIALMQKAADISAAAHARAIKICRPGLFEYELEAELLYEFTRQGARSTAYGSIVGGGKNSCVLHYVTNNAQLKDGDIVLIDAGCEYENYASDITRTFPANGKFSAEQRAIYDLVLTAQLAAIETIKPGASWMTAQDIIVKTITQGLIDLKLLHGELDGLIEQQAYFNFYMHRSGHWIGLDVHDVGQYKINHSWRPLAEGMALTVEPGIYISSHIPNIPERWHNIGVRIEDDVVVTATGHHVLTQKLVKSAKDIEDLMRSS